MWWRIVFCDDHSVQQRREQSAQPDQDQTVQVPQPNPLLSASEYQQLLAQDEYLRLTRRTGDPTREDVGRLRESGMDLQR